MWMRRYAALAPVTNQNHQNRHTSSFRQAAAAAAAAVVFLSFLPAPPFHASLLPSFVVPTHVASAPFLSEAFGKIEYADDRRDRGRGSGRGGGAKANAEAASPPSLPPPAMQTKFGATGKSY